MHRQLLRYNFRICAGLGPWLIVVPVAASMLVLFALMSMTALVRASTPIVVMELLGPLLLAFVAANLLRPEYQYNSLETILTRPVSFRVILTVRVLVAGLAVLALQALLCLYIRTVMHIEFDPLRALLAAGVSMAFLGSLAIAVAAAWRSPTLGVGAAAAVWALDLVAGPALNPLLTLRGYSEAVARPDNMWDLWTVGKAVLAALTVLLIVVGARAARQPAAQRTVRRVVRSAVAIVLIALVYIVSGATWKVEWLRRHELGAAKQSRLMYQQAFRIYGRLPVAYLFGPAFAGFVGYRPPWAKLPQDGGEGRATLRAYDIEQLKIAAFGHPNSRWADNALFELGRMATQEGEPAEAEDPTPLGIDCLQSLAADYPSSPFTPPALERLTYVYDRLGRSAEAEEAGRRLLALYPDHEAAGKAGTMLLERFTAQNRMQDAVWVAERLVRSGPEDDRPDALVELGCLLVDMGRHKEAEARFNEAIDLSVELTMESGAGEKSYEDIDRFRELGAARRRAIEELEILSQESQPPSSEDRSPDPSSRQPSMPSPAAP